MENKIKYRFDYIDRRVIEKSKRLGHRLERYLIGVLFCWFGLLKLAGEASATSIMAKSIYWWDAEIMVPILGGWEVLMGLCLLFRPTIRIAIGLFFLRLPGTFLALLYHWDECFMDTIFVPTIQGQYLLKELSLVGAALIIASTLPPLITDSKKSSNIKK